MAATSNRLLVGWRLFTGPQFAKKMRQSFDTDRSVRTITDARYL
jgi:hypothetical protein